LSFREISKVPLQATVPPEIDHAVREVAFREKISISAAATMLLCQALKVDPAAFGLDGRPRAKRRPTSVA
jgi:hypothetical protein